jgi:hypothetical protein
MYGFLIKPCGSTVRTAPWSGTPEKRAMTVTRRSFRPLVWPSELEERVVLNSYAAQMSDMIEDATAHIRQASKLPNAHRQQIQIQYDQGTETDIDFPNGGYLSYRYDSGEPQWAPQTGKLPPNGSDFEFVFNSGAGVNGVWGHGRLHESGYTPPAAFGEL